MVKGKDILSPEMKRARSPSPEPPPEPKRVHLESPCPELLPELWDLVIPMLPMLDRLVVMHVSRAMEQRALTAIAAHLVGRPAEDGLYGVVGERRGCLYRVTWDEFNTDQVRGGEVVLALDRFISTGGEWLGWPAVRVFLLKMACPYRRCTRCGKRTSVPPLPNTSPRTLLCCSEACLDACGAGVPF